MAIDSLCNFRINVLKIAGIGYCINKQKSELMKDKQISDCRSKAVDYDLCNPRIKRLKQMNEQRNKDINNESTNKWMNQQLNEWINKWMNKRTNKQMNEWENKSIK